MERGRRRGGEEEVSNRFYARTLSRLEDKLVCSFRVVVDNVRVESRSLCLSV